ncbi:MAG: hypothetical protein ACREYF_19085, partial [Gammaproteobacteria bacterium]
MRSRSKNRSLYRKTAFKALVAALVLGFGSGALGGQDTEFDINISAATLTSEAEELGVTTERGSFESILSLQKDLVRNILSQAGIDPDKLSAEVRAALDRPHTNNVDAFLAFSQGLDFLDQGRYAEARAGFQQAAELDPQFEMATQYRDTTPVSQERAGDIAEASIREAQQTPPAVSAPSTGSGSGGPKGSGGEPEDDSAGRPQAVPEAAGKSPAPKNASEPGSKATTNDSSAGEKGAAAAGSENALGDGSAVASLIKEVTADGAVTTELLTESLTIELLTESPPAESLAESPPPEPLTESPPPEPLTESPPPESLAESPPPEPLTESAPAESLAESPLLEPLTGSPPPEPLTESPPPESLTESPPPESLAESPLLEPLTESPPPESLA